MGAYQYYEFQAVDRPLGRDEMEILRGVSTRARITSTSFTNEYSYGDFKGNAEDWMAKYFDAFVHYAAWGTALFMLRIPSRLLNMEAVRPYIGQAGDYGKPIQASDVGRSIVLRFCATQEEGWDGSMECGELMGHLLPIRSELASGDLRALYIGWLRILHEGGDIEGLEPPVPPGLKSLSPALVDLMEFLRIDPDLAAAAAETSADLVVTQFEDADLERWVAGLPVAEKDEFLVRLMKEGGSAAGIEVRNRMAAGRSPTGAGVPGVRRRIRELLDAADRVRHARKEADARKAEEARTQIQREAAAARSRRLEVLATRIPATWTRIESLIQARQEKSYAEAIQLLDDLKELDLRRRVVPDFGRRLADIRAIHAKKRTFIDQLASKGL